MFQGPRHLFHRSQSVTAAGPKAPSKVDGSPRLADRQPRGLDLSPVHGRHCICACCERHQRSNAA